MNIRFIKSVKGEKEFCSKCNQEVKAVKTNRSQWVKGSSAYGNSHISSCCEARMYFAVKAVNR